MLAKLFLLSSVAVANADKQSLDCPLRQLAVDMAQKLQPSRPMSAFQELADALNGAQEAQNCSVAPTAAHNSLRSSANKESRVPSIPLPPSGSHVVYVDALVGSDSNLGTTQGSPMKTLPAALAAIRATRAAKGFVSASKAPRAYLVLRAGTFFLGKTLTLTPEDSNVNFQAFPGEDAVISGAVPISGVTWNSAPVPSYPAWEYRAGVLDAGFDVLPAQTMTPGAAQTLCQNTPSCTAIAYAGPQTPTGPVLVSFKHKTFYAGGAGNVWVLNRGLLPGGANLYVADLSTFALESDIDALRVGGVRAIRARYPNAVTVEDIDAMQLVAQSWTKQPMPKTSEYTVELPPFRNDSANDGNGIPYFTAFRLGVGGPCAQRFTPQASYWCANYTQGGGPGPYSAPIGLTASTTTLPHTPYKGDVTRANVHSWRAGRWFSWVFAVNGSTSTPTSTTFTFSLDKGGNQGSRGGDAGQEFFIENVMDELDSPGEFFYDQANAMLYLFHNASGAPVDGTVVATQLTELIAVRASQQAPVTGVGFHGITFRDSAPNYLGPHGTPSGGDWAVGRSAALFFEGTTGTTLDGCLFTSLDGNGVFFSGFNRNASVTNSEFLSIGETAIVQWGYTDGSPIPGMGFNGTSGNQPRGTLVGYNLVHEVGLYTKQNSFYFQSETIATRIEGNIAYNGPRAGINLDDGMGGGTVITKNVLANFCR